MELELPWFDKVLNPNNKVHWAKEAHARKKQKDTAFWIAKEADTPPEQAIYNLNIMFHPPIKRNRDIDNALASIKGALDGIALAWGVNDTNFRFPNLDFGDTVENGKIIITIT